MPKPGDYAKYRKEDGNQVKYGFPFPMCLHVLQFAVLDAIIDINVQSD